MPHGNGDAAAPPAISAAAPPLSTAKARSGKSGMGRSATAEGQSKAAPAASQGKTIKAAAPRHTVRAKCGAEFVRVKSSAAPASTPVQMNETARNTPQLIRYSPSLAALIISLSSSSSSSERCGLSANIAAGSAPSISSTCRARWRTISPSVATRSSTGV